LSYETTLAWLCGLEVRRGMDFRLARLGPVLDALDHPEGAFPAIHVAGTNGKGSTAAMLHAAYTAGGLRAGLYTSPHLLSFRERIRVGTDLIDEEAVVAHAARVRDAMTGAGVRLTFFEIATLMAFLEFRRREVDLAVVEVGLGGRLDATNVVHSVAAVVTSIGYDHQAYLGDSIECIAREKAGIIRADIPVVTGDLPHEAVVTIERIRGDYQAPWLRYGRDFGPWPTDARVSLAGEHQRVNRAVAAATTRLLAGRFPLAPGTVERALATVRWPGRLECFAGAPAVVVDAAHNPEAVHTLCVALPAVLARLGTGRRRVLLFGAMGDKPWAEMLSRLVPMFDEVVLAPVDTPRSFDPRSAADAVAGQRACRVAASATHGLELARRQAGPEGSIVVTGSIFLAAELYVMCGGDEEPFVSRAI
jgi:dihydrofolate synthase/folylpolyglutamate synthase